MYSGVWYSVISRSLYRGMYLAAETLLRELNYHVYLPRAALTVDQLRDWMFNMLGRTTIIALGFEYFIVGVICAPLRHINVHTHTNLGIQGHSNRERERWERERSTPTRSTRDITLILNFAYQNLCWISFDGSSSVSLVNRFGNISIHSTVVVRSFRLFVIHDRVVLYLRVVNEKP